MLKRNNVVDLATVVDHLWTNHEDGDAKDCIDAFRRAPNVWRLSGIEDIRKLAKCQRMLEGELICEVLDAWYGIRYLDVTSRLGAVYAYLNGLNEDRFPTELDDQFHVGSRGYQAALFYATEAQVALVEWVDAWNRKVRRANELKNAKLMALDS